MPAAAVRSWVSPSTLPTEPTDPARSFPASSSARAPLATLSESAAASLASCSNVGFASCLKLVRTPSMAWRADSACAFALARASSMLATPASRSSAAAFRSLRTFSSSSAAAVPMAMAPSRDGSASGSAACTAWRLSTTER